MRTEGSESIAPKYCVRLLAPHARRIALGSRLFRRRSPTKSVSARLSSARRRAIGVCLLAPLAADRAMEAADFVVTRGQRSASPRFSSARRRAIRGSPENCRLKPWRLSWNWLA
jgi:hypothetical protein